MVTLGIAGPQDCYNVAVHVANTRRTCCHANANGKHRFPVAARRPEQASFSPLSDSIDLPNSLTPASLSLPLCPSYLDTREQREENVLSL